MLFISKRYIFLGEQHTFLRINANLLKSLIVVINMNSIKQTKSIQIVNRVI